MPVTLNALREFLVWLVAVGIVVLAIRRAGRFVAFILDELYQIFIQHS